MFCVAALATSDQFHGLSAFPRPRKSTLQNYEKYQKKEIDSSKLWEIPKKGNRLFKIMRNTKKRKFAQNYEEYMGNRPFNIMRKKEIDFSKKCFFLPFKQRNLLSIFLSIFWLIITRNIFLFLLQFPIAQFVVPSGCVVKANIAQRHWKKNCKSRYSED